MAYLERGRVPSARPIASKEVPLVDRTEEMKLLKEAVYNAVHGEGSLVFIHGEAGIGKTRLLRELGAYAQSRGVQFLYGRCPALFRMDGVPPYILWKEVIKDYLETCTPEQLYRVIGYYPAEVAKLVPELSQKFRTIPQSFPISPEQEQNRLFEAVSQFISNISKETPLLVVLDDLQWTDPSSLLLLHYIACCVQKTSLLLLGAYRSTDIDAKHPLTPVLAELKREHLPQSISLKRMSLEDTSEMTKQILEQDDVPSEFCKMVYEKTRGNPFFTEEVIESLKEEEIIFREDNKWKIKEVSKIEFPETVKSVVKARIDRLDNEWQKVLTMASLIGNDFTFDALQIVVGLEEDKLRKIVDELLKTGLLKYRVVHGEDLCSFADIIVRDVVYEEVGTFERKKLHGLLGSALETIYAEDINEHLGELANHFLEGGEKGKALDYFLRAGERAENVYANAEAASYFQSALTLLEEKESELQERGSVLERLGDIKMLVGEYEACIRSWDEALLLWIRKQGKEKTATLHRKMANVLWEKMGDDEKAREHHEAALKILETEPESVELARLYEDIAHMHRRKGEVAQALTWAEKALGLAEKLNALEAVADSSSELALLLGFMGDLKKGLEYANRALKIALENNYLKTALWAYERVATLLPSQEYEKRMEYFKKELALAKKLGDISRRSGALCILAYEYVSWGEFDKVITLGEEALVLDKRAGNATYIPWDLHALGYAYQALGEWEKSEKCISEALESARKLNEFQQISENYHLNGLLHFDKEEYSKAKESFEEAVRMHERAGTRTGQLYSSQFLIWTLIELGEIEKASDLLADMGKFVLETPSEKYFDLNEKALSAMLLRAQKKHQESIELFEKTIKEWESIKANIWNAYYFARWVLSEYARACLERDQQGDKEKALNLLNRALEMFRKMRAKKDIEKVEARLLYAETGHVALEPKPTSLITTGSPDLDKLLYGGIPPNYAIVLASPSCDKKNLLIRNFLETGAKKNEVTFYVTIDPNLVKPLAREFPSSFYLVVCNPQADAIVESTSNTFELAGVENLTDISIALTSAIRKLDPTRKGPKRICIDLLSDVLLQHHAVQTRRWLTALIAELKSKGFTILGVIDPQIHPSEELHAIIGLFDGEISIYEKGAEKYLKIKKMSNQKYLNSELLLGKENFQN